MDSFSLLYLNLFYPKLCLFVFDATLAALHLHFITICSCFIRDLCLWAVTRTLCETPYLEFAGSNPIPINLYSVFFDVIIQASLQE